MSAQTVVINFSSRVRSVQGWHIEEDNDDTRDKREKEIPIEQIDLLEVRIFLNNLARSAVYYTGRGHLGSLNHARQLADAWNKGKSICPRLWRGKRVVFPATKLSRGEKNGLPYIYKNGKYRVGVLPMSSQPAKDLYYCRINIPRD